MNRNLLSFACVLLFACSAAPLEEDEEGDEAALTSDSSDNVKVLQQINDRGNWYANGERYWVANERGASLAPMGGQAVFTAPQPAKEITDVLISSGSAAVTVDRGLFLVGLSAGSSAKPVSTVKVASKLASDAAGAIYFVGSAPESEGRSLDLVRLDPAGSTTVVSRDFFTKECGETKLLVDAEWVFGTNCGELVRVKKAGGSAQVIAGGARISDAIQTDTAIIFAMGARGTNPNVTSNRIVQVNKSDAAPVARPLVTLSERSRIGGLAVRQQHLWFAYAERAPTNAESYWVGKARLVESAPAQKIARLPAIPLKSVMVTKDGVAFELTNNWNDSATVHRLVHVTDGPALTEESSASDPSAVSR